MHVVILGAGFGGLELASRLSEAHADRIDVTLIDHSDGFVFGFSKLDVLTGRRSAEQVRLPYTDVVLPGVELRREHVTSIDPAQRRVVTDQGVHDADILVVALGADYDPDATPGFVETGYEFYSVQGAERLRDRLATFTGGDLLIAILGVPFKCPPAPYEGALLMHDMLVEAGVRDATRMELVTPMAMPIPVSAPASDAILAALAARDIHYTPNHRVHSLDPATRQAHMGDQSRHFDLFVGIPVHRVPDVVEESGLTLGGNDGWVAVDAKTLQTPFPGVYAIGDCSDAPVPRAGALAEAAARTVAEHIGARLTGVVAAPFGGAGACYVELGDGLVGKVAADFLTGPAPVAPFHGPSKEYAEEKAQWAAERRARWFVNGSQR